MGLTCTCECDIEPGTVWWEPESNFNVLRSKRSKRCASCKKRVAPGDVCVVVSRGKVAQSAVEEAIYGEGELVPRANAYLCEECGGLMYSLEDLGFCQHPWEDQRELVKEYAALQKEQRERTGPWWKTLAS